MKTVSLEEARGALGDLVDRARLADEPTLITRYGKPAAVVVSAEWYQVAADVFASLEPGDHGYDHKPAGAINGPSGGQGER